MHDVTSRGDQRLRLGELQRRDGEDLSFGGWRDWLLLVVGLPIFVGALYGGAMLAIGSKSGGFLLSPEGGLTVAGVALLAGLALGSSSRVRRRMRQRD